MFDDLQEELHYGKQAFDYIAGKDMPACGEEMTDHCTFVVDWFNEPLPLEDKDGTSLDSMVRKMICDSCHRDEVPPTPKEDAPKKEDVLVFADQAGLCSKVLDMAPEGRVGTKKIVTKPPGLLTTEELESLIGSKTWDLVIVACPLDPPKSTATKDIIDAQNHVAKFMLNLMQTCFKKDGCCKRMAVLTHDIFSMESDTNAERGLAAVTNSTMYGFCNTSRLEMEFPVYLIDTELVDDEVMYPLIATELFRAATFGVNTVRLCYPYPIKDGIRTGRPYGRQVIRQLPSTTYRMAERKFEIPAEGVIGISGGNGALALVMGEWLLATAERFKMESGGTYEPKFSIQFLSRSMKISDLNMPRWKDIQAKAESMGIHVEQAKLDMGTQDAVDTWIKSVSPNIIGFIHSAGVLQDSMLMNQTWEKFETVYDGKHRAALFLHDALERFANPNLKFFWLFSSTSVYGNMGQLNYSSSNAFLDGLARHRRALGKPCMAPQWGAWGDVGMAANLDDASRRRMANSPMPYFSNAEGLYGLECGLRTNLPYFSVFKVNPPLLFGMIMGDDVAIQCYTRNFSSEYVPPPPGYDPNKNHYSTITYETRKSNHKLGNGLVFSTHWPEAAEDMRYYGQD